MSKDKNKQDHRSWLWALKKVSIQLRSSNIVLDRVIFWIYRSLVMEVRKRYKWTFIVTFILWLFFPVTNPPAHIFFLITSGELFISAAYPLVSDFPDLGRMSDKIDNPPPPPPCGFVFLNPLWIKLYLYLLKWGPGLFSQSSLGSRTNVFLEQSF